MHSEPGFSPSVGGTRALAVSDAIEGNSWYGEAASRSLGRGRVMAWSVPQGTKGIESWTVHLGNQTLTSPNGGRAKAPVVADAVGMVGNMGRFLPGL